MLKHSDVIEKLNRLQKVALVASAFDARPFEQMDIPAVRIQPLDGDKNAISYGSAARSWNPELVGKMTEVLIAAKGCKNNLFVTPDLKTAVVPSRAGLSEDACLNGEVGGAILRSAHKVGAYVGVARPTISAEEIAQIDSAEDTGAVHELFVQPFLRAVHDNPCDAVFVDPSRETGYYDTNRSLLCEVQNGLLGEDVFVVGEGETFTADAVGLLRGKMTLGGCTIPLERAVRRYAQLIAYEAEGSIPHREVEDSLAGGNAIDDETLDTLVDNIIDFALTLDAAELRTQQTAVETYDSEASSAQPVAVESFETTQIAEPSASEQPSAESSANEQPIAEQTASEQPIEEQPSSEQPQQPTAEQASEQQPQTSETLAENVADFALQQTPVSEEQNAPEQQSEKAQTAVETTIEQPAVAQFEPSAPAADTTYAPVEEFADPDVVGKQIATESIVLLKNNKLLPLAKGKRIAIVGEAYRNMAAFDRFSVVGRARGYDRTAQRSDNLIPAAVRATKNADAVVVFLHPDNTGKLSLPANRIALLAALKKARKRVVAVVLGDLPVDMSFDASTDALLVAPSDGPFAAEALADILCGNVAPSGKLTRTCYDNADEYFRRYHADKDAGVMRIGSFVGYRRLGIEKTKVRYPFGFGLSYTKFAYSNLSLEESGISFTLANTGSCDGSEVVQVYVGVPGTSRVVPQKQLRAFRKVFLRKGESRKISFALSERDFETYDSASYTDNVEAGDYVIYVGSSPLDVRLTGKKTLQGVTRDKEKYTYADYSPNGDYGDVSRVGIQNRLTQKSRDLPKPMRIANKVARYALPVCAIAFFLLLSIVIVSMSVNHFLLTAFEQNVVQQFMFLAAVITIALIPIFGSLNRKRLVRVRNASLILTPILIAVCLVLYTVMISGGQTTGSQGTEMQIAINLLACITIGTPIMAVLALLLERQLWRDKKGKNHWDKYYFEKEYDGKTTVDEEFDKAMRAAEAAREAKAAKQKADEQPVVIAEVPQFYDRRLTLEQLLSDCQQFVTEYGLQVQTDVLRNWIAALISSRLIFVPQGGGAALCQAVSEYFGRKTYVDNAENYTRFDDLFSEWQNGGYTSLPTNLMRALDKAEKETAYLHTVLIRHVNKNSVEMLFRPLADVVMRKKITFPVGDKSFSLPENIVIVVELECDKPDLPESIAEIAAQLSPEVSEGQPAERRTIVQTVGFERLTALRRNVRDDYPLDEDVWKEVDALDDHCKSAHIGNNMWNRMEMHASVVLACGGEPDEAVDGAIAVELLPWLVTVWKDDVCGCTLPAALVDSFGDKLIQSTALLQNAQEEQ